MFTDGADGSGGVAPPFVDSLVSVPSAKGMLSLSILTIAPVLGRDEHASMNARLH